MAVGSFAIVLLSSTSLASVGTFSRTSERIVSEQTFLDAEAGLQESLYRLWLAPNPQSFTLNRDGTTVEVTAIVNPNNSYQRIIRSKATDPSSVVRTVQIVANTSGSAAGFDYAVQAGHGGIEILNNSEVVGGIYANGNIFGGTGASIQARVNGQTWVARGTPLETGPAQEALTGEFAFANAAATIDVAQSFQASTDAPLKEVTVLIRRTGVLPGDLTLRIVRDGGGHPNLDTLAVKTIKKNDVPSTFAWLATTFDIGPFLKTGQTYWIVLDAPTFDPTKYILWRYSSDGDAYANGKATKTSDFASGSWTDVGGDFTFRTKLGSGDTFVRQVEVTGNLHAHQIDRSIVHGDAYYQELEDSTVDGSTFPGSVDPDPKPFPITDAQITDWETRAETGGTTSGDVTINGTTSLGPRKIVGNLSLSGDAHLIVTGHLWVTGNITFINPNLNVSLDPSFGEGSGVIVADGKIDVNNNATIAGSGNPRSFLLLLSTNYSLDPSSPAINAANNAEAVVFYAHNGMVRLYNGSHLNGTSGYYVRLEEGSSITYNPALASFTVPTGGENEVGTALGTWEEL